LPLGAGLDNTVYAIAINSQSGDVYVGGNFTTANSGSITVNRIAKYNTQPQLWEPLGTGLSATVHALAINGDTVYIGGAFTGANVTSTTSETAWAITKYSSA
jgi:hypothetical protein